MKKIFSIALAATLLAAGCQKTEVIGLDDSKTGPAMTFSTEMKKITKVADPTATGFENLTEQGFNVWAYADYDIANATNVDKTTGIFDGMSNWYVGASTTNNTTSWSARKEFYWPGKGKKLQFFAVSGSGKNSSTDADNPSPINYNWSISPVFKVNDDITVTPAPTVPTLTITDFTVSANANDDLMVADFLTQDQESQDTDTPKGTVALNFRHALSKVQFVFMTPEIEKGPNVYVQRLTVTNLNDKGTLTVQPKESTAVSQSDETVPNVPVTTEVTPSWSDQGDSDATAEFFVKSNNECAFKDETGKEISIDYLLDKDGKKVYNDACGDLLDPKKPSTLATWLMIPQTLTEDNQIEVIYLINNRQFKAIFPLIANDKNNTSISEWAVNKFTKYTITLSPNLITFDADVEDDWETADNEIEHQN